MKTLACKDLGVKECDFVAKGETGEEVVKTMMDHGMSAHKDKIDEMAKTMTPEEMHAKMLASVKDEG